MSVAPAPVALPLITPQSYCDYPAGNMSYVANEFAGCETGDTDLLTSRERSASVTLALETGNISLVPGNYEVVLPVDISVGP